MNSKQRENLRLLLLTAMNAARPYAVSREALAIGLPTSFRHLPDSELQGEIDYLVDKGFAVTGAKQISPENQEWKITAAGRDFLATEGLA